MFIYMSTNCNESDIEYLTNEIHYLYHKMVNIQLFIGGILLISSICSMAQNSTIITSINKIKTIIYPPVYKTTDA